MIPAGKGRLRPAFPFAVALIAALNVAVFAAELRAPDPGALIDALATIPYDVTHGIVLAAPSPPLPVLTLVSAMFVHAGVWHIGSNLLVLLAAGGAVEYACGHLRFAAFYLLCGIAGGVAQIAAAPGSHVPEIGASGAIAGVLGAYVMTYPLKPAAVLLILAWAATQFTDGLGSLSPLALVSGGTAYFAHIGGFSCGVLAIALFRRKAAGTRGFHW